MANEEEILNPEVAQNSNSATAVPEDIDFNSDRFKPVSNGEPKKSAQSTESTENIDFNSDRFKPVEAPKQTISANEYAKAMEKIDLLKDNLREFSYNDNSDYSEAEQRWLFDANRNLPKEDIEAGKKVFDEANKGVFGGDYYFDPETYQPKLLKEGEEPPVDPLTGAAVQLFGANGYDRFLNGLANGAVAGAGIGMWGGVPGAAVGALAGGLFLGVVNAFGDDEDYILAREEGNSVTDDNTLTTMLKTFNNTLMNSTEGAAALLKLASEGIMGNETVFSDLYDATVKTNKKTQMSINPFVPADFQTEKAWDSTAEFFNAANYNFEAIPIMISQGLASAAQYMGAGASLKMAGKGAGYLAKKASTKIAAKQARKKDLTELANKLFKAGDDEAAKTVVKQLNSISNVSQKAKNNITQFGAGMLINNSEIMAQIEEVDGLSLREKSAYALLATAGMSAVEMFAGPDAAAVRKMLAKGGIVKEVQNEVVEEVKKYAGKKLTGKQLKKIHDKAYGSMMEKTANFFKKTPKSLIYGAISEGGEELVQSVWQDAAASMANQYYELDDENGFNVDMASPETWTGYFNAFASGALTGSTMNAPQALKAGRYANAIAMAGVVSGEDSGRKIGLYKDQLRHAVKTGKITKEEQKNAISLLSTFEEYNKEMAPFDLSTGRKKDAFVHRAEMQYIEENHDMDNLPDEVKLRYDEHQTALNEIIKEGNEIPQKKKDAAKKRAEKAAEKAEKAAKEETETPEQAEARNAKDNTSDADHFNSLVDKAVSDKELDALLNQADAKGLSTEEFVLKVAKRREDLKRKANDGAMETAPLEEETGDEEKTSKPGPIDEQIGDEEKPTKSAPREEKDGNEAGEQVEMDSKEINAEKEKSKANTSLKTANAKVTYRRKGKIGTLNVKEGNYVFETPEEVIILGKQNEVENDTLADFGLERVTDNAIDIDKNENVVIDGETFVNPHTKKSAAGINKAFTTENGVVTEVTLLDKTGAKKVFTGSLAQDIAMRYSLNQAQKDVVKRARTTARTSAEYKVKKERERQAKYKKEVGSEDTVIKPTEADQKETILKQRPVDNTDIQDYIVEELTDNQTRFDKVPNKKDPTRVSYKDKQGKHLKGITKALAETKDEFEAEKLAIKLVQDQTANVGGDPSKIDIKDPEVQRLLENWRFRTQTGTDVHAVAEQIVQGMTDVQQEKELKKEPDADKRVFHRSAFEKIKEFIDKLKADGSEILTELEIVDPYTGSIMIADIVKVNRDGTLEVYDFKLKKMADIDPDEISGVNEKEENFYKKGTPLEGVRQTKASDYAYQLKAIKRALERQGHTVSKIGITLLGADFSTNQYATGQFRNKASNFTMGPIFDPNEYLTDEQMAAVEKDLAARQGNPNAQSRARITGTPKEWVNPRKRGFQPTGKRVTDNAVEQQYLNSKNELERIRRENPELAPVIDAILSKGIALYTRIAVVDESQIDGAGQFSYVQKNGNILGDVAITLKHAVNSRNPNAKGKKYSDSVLVHEEVHRYTSALLDLFAMHPESLSKAEKEFAEQINALYDLYRQNSDKRFAHVDNVKEFLAYGLTDKAFIELLKQRKIDGVSIWQRMIDAIKKLLGSNASIHNGLEHVFNEFMKLDSPTINRMKQDQFYKPVSVNIGDGFIRMGETVSEFVARSQPLATGIPYGPNLFDVYPGNLIVGKTKDRALYVQSPGVQAEILGKAGLIQNKWNPSIKEGQKPSTQQTQKIKTGPVTEPDKQLIEALEKGKEIKGKLIQNADGSFSMEREKANIHFGKAVFDNLVFPENGESNLGKEVYLRLVKKKDWNPAGDKANKKGEIFGDKIEVRVSESRIRIGHVPSNNGAAIEYKEYSVDDETAVIKEGNEGTEQFNATTQGNNDTVHSTIVSEVKDKSKKLFGNLGFFKKDIAQSVQTKSDREYIDTRLRNTRISDNHIGNEKVKVILAEAHRVIKRAITIDNAPLNKAIKRGWDKAKALAKEQDITIYKRAEEIWKLSLKLSNENVGATDNYLEYEDLAEEQLNSETIGNNEFGSEELKGERIKNSGRVRQMYDSVEGHHPSEVWEELYDYVMALPWASNNMEEILTGMKGYNTVLNAFVANFESNFELSDMVSLVNAIRTLKKRPFITLMVGQNIGRPEDKLGTKSSFSLVNDSPRSRFSLFNIMHERRRGIEDLKVEFRNADGKSGLYDQFTARKTKIGQLITFFNKKNGATLQTIDGVEDWYAQYEGEYYSATDIAKIVIANEAQFLMDLTGFDEKTVMTWLETHPKYRKEGVLGTMLSNAAGNNFLWKMEGTKPQLSKTYFTPIQGDWLGFRTGFPTYQAFYENATKKINNNMTAMFKNGVYGDKFYNEEKKLKSSAPVMSWALDRLDNILNIADNDFYRDNKIVRYYKDAKNMPAPVFFTSGIKHLKTAIGASGKNIPTEDLAVIEFMGFMDSKNSMLNENEYFHSLGQFADKSTQGFIPVQKLTTEEAKAEIEKIRASDHPNKDSFPTNKEIIESVERHTNLVEKWSQRGVLGTENQKAVFEKEQEVAAQYVLNYAIHRYYLDNILFGRNSSYGSTKEKQQKGKAKRAGSGGSGGIAPMMGLPNGLPEFYNQVIFEDTNLELFVNVEGDKKSLNPPKPTGKVDEDGNDELETQPFENADGIIFISPKMAEMMQVSYGSAFKVKDSAKVLYFGVDDNANAILDKSHWVVVTKELRDANPKALGAIYEAMMREKDPIHTVSFKTSSKLYEQVDANGNPVDVITPVEYSKQGQISSFDASKANILKRKSANLRLQQDLNNEGKKVDKRIIPQMLRHIKRLVGNSAVDSVLQEYVQQKKADFLYELDNMDDSQKRDFLLETLKDSESNAEIRELLVSGVPLENQLVGRYIASTIGNTLKKNVLDIMGKGSLLTTISDVGLDTKLKGPYVKDGVTYPGECLVPENSGYKENDILLITRMPADDLHSIGYVRVVGFLPASSGNKIAVDEVTRFIAGEDLDGDQRHVWARDSSEKAKYLDPNSVEAIKRLDKENIKAAKINALQAKFPDTWKYYVGKMNDIFTKDAGAPRISFGKNDNKIQKLGIYEAKLKDYLDTFFDERVETDYTTVMPMTGLSFGKRRYKETYANSPSALANQLFDQTIKEYQDPKNFEAITHAVDTNRLDDKIKQEEQNQVNQYLPGHGQVVYEANKSTRGSNSVIGIVAKSIATFIELQGNKVPIGRIMPSLEYQKKAKETYELLGDALNQATDNAKLQKLRLMNLTNDNASVWLAMASLGKPIEEIIAFFELPNVKSYFDKVARQGLVGDTAIDNNMYPNELLELAFENKLERDENGNITGPQEFLELKSYLDLSSELFQFGQIMNATEKGLSSWTELQLAINAVRKIKNGKFRKLGLNTNMPFMANLISAVDGANKTLERFSLMKTKQAEAYMNDILYYFKIDLDYLTKSQGTALERIIETKLTNDAYNNGLSAEQVYAKLEKELEQIDKDAYGYFQYVEKSFDTFKSNPTFGLASSLRHNTDSGIMANARKEFDRLPNNIRQLFIEYNAKKYGNTYSTKSGALSRTISVAGQLDFGNRLHKLAKNWDQEGQPITEAEIFTYAIQNPDIIPYAKISKEGNVLSKKKRSAKLLKTQKGKKSPVAVIEKGKVVGQAKSLFKWKEALEQRAIEDAAQKEIEEKGRPVKSGELFQKKEITDAVKEIWKEMEDTKEWKNLSSLAASDSTFKNSVSPTKAKKYLADPSKIPNIPEKEQIQEAVRNFWTGYAKKYPSKEVATNNNASRPKVNTSKSALELRKVPVIQEIDGKVYVNTMRKNGNEHFGNPFTGTNNGIDTIKLPSVEMAVQAYKDWILGEETYLGNYNLHLLRKEPVNPSMKEQSLEEKSIQEIKPEQREWILSQIESGKLDNATFLYMNDRSGYKSHADALVEVVSERRTDNHAGQRIVDNHKTFTKNNSRAMANNLKSENEIIDALKMHLAERGINVPLDSITYLDAEKILSINGDKEHRDRERRSKNLNGTWLDDQHNYHYDEGQPVTDQEDYITSIEWDDDTQHTRYLKNLERLSEAKAELEEQESDPDTIVDYALVQEIADLEQTIETSLKAATKRRRAPGPMSKSKFRSKIFGETIGKGQENSLTPELQEQLNTMYNEYKEEWAKVQTALFIDGKILFSEQALNKELNDAPDPIAELEDTIRRVQQTYSTVASEFPLKILQDRLAKEQILKMIREEHSENHNRRKTATRALYDILTITNNQNEDWDQGALSTGIYSIKSPSTLIESVMQLNETLIRERARQTQIEGADLNDRFKALYKKIEDVGADIRTLIKTKTYKNGTIIEYFIPEGTAEYRDLVQRANNGDKKAEALKAFLDAHIAQEVATGKYSWDRELNAYRVPQVEADVWDILFGELNGFKDLMKILKNVKVVDAFKSKFASKNKMDAFIIKPDAVKNLAKYGITEKSTYKFMKNQIIQSMPKGNSLPDLKKSAQALRTLRALQSYAEQQMDAGIDDSGKTTNLKGVDKVSPGVGFEKTETTTTNVAAAVSQHHQGMVFKKNFEGIEPVLKFVEGHLERNGNVGQAEWLRIHNRDVLYREKPQSNIKKYAKIIDSLSSFTYFKMLGANWFGSLFNGAAGFAQSAREMKTKNLVRGIARIAEQIPSKNPTDAFLNNRAVKVLNMFDIVSVSQNTELNITQKTAAKISNAVFFNIVLPEYLNHAYSFIGNMTDAEWSSISPLIDRGATREEVAIALGGYTGDIATMDANDRAAYLKAGMFRIDQLQEDTQRINGNYSTNSRRRYNDTPEGRLVMMFKRWMPEIWLAHVSPEYYDMYGHNRKGIFNSIPDVAKTLNTFEGWKELAWTFKPGGVPNERFNTLSEVDRVNMRKIVKEAFLIGGIALASSLTMGDDDEKQTAQQREMSKLLDRLLSDTAFIYRPKNLIDLIKSPFPVTSTIEDIYNLGAQIITRDVYKTNTDRHDAGDSKTWSLVEKNIPIFAQARATSRKLTNVYEYINE